MIRVALGLMCLALAGCKPAGPAAGEGAQSPAGEPLAIASEAVEIGPGQVTGLRLRGTRTLSSDHPAFGGFSGLLVSPGRIRAVTDAGWWLEASLEEAADGMVPGNAKFYPLFGSDGEALDKAGGDAEGLAELNGQVWVTFERDHRIAALGPDWRETEIVQERTFEAMGSNQGLEALAGLPDGHLIAIGEDPVGAGHPVYVSFGEGPLQQGSLPPVPPYSVTGADMGPDGRLYLVLRHYTPLTGVRIRIDRMALASNGMPDPTTRQILAEYESASGIDNMEGISVWTDAAGRPRLTLISDDNFNFVQRTLLMDFEIVD